MEQIPSTWQPQTVLRYVRTVRSSSRTAFVQTDAGGAYLKAVNNPEGPHVLACDWFGTHLARRFGLPTFDMAVVPLTELDEIQLEANLWAGTGAAFVAREEKGQTMGGPSGRQALFTGPRPLSGGTTAGDATRRLAATRIGFFRRRRP